MNTKYRKLFNFPKHGGWIILSFVIFGVFARAALCGPPFQRGQVQGISRFPGTRESLEYLLRHGFVVTGRARDSMVDFYQPPHRLPPFVTTDAAWDFFQRLVEKAFFFGEKGKASSLPSFLKKVLEGVLERRSPSAGKALKYTALACLLSGVPVEKMVTPHLGGARETRELGRFAGLLESEKEDRGRIQPPFLRSGLPPLFRPKSIYAGSETYRRYWRSVQWLQYGLFRMDDPEEGQAGILLAQVVLEC